MPKYRHIVNVKCDQCKKIVKEKDLKDGLFCVKCVRQMKFQLKQISKGNVNVVIVTE